MTKIDINYFLNATNTWKEIMLKNYDKQFGKHTPGPWKIVSSWNDYMVEGPNGEEIIWQDGNYGTPTISKADAYLIAAAPDLLEALQNLENDDESIPKHAWDMVQNAIAKATGSKP